MIRPRSPAGTLLAPASSLRELWNGATARAQSAGRDLPHEGDCTPHRPEHEQPNRRSRTNSDRRTMPNATDVRVAPSATRMPISLVRSSSLIVERYVTLTRCVPGRDAPATSHETVFLIRTEQHEARVFDGHSRLDGAPYTFFSAFGRRSTLTCTSHDLRHFAFQSEATAKATASTSALFTASSCTTSRNHSAVGSIESGLLR
jgi:hypothetical protein